MHPIKAEGKIAFRLSRVSHKHLTANISVSCLYLVWLIFVQKPLIYEWTCVSGPPDSPSESCPSSVSEIFPSSFPLSLRLSTVISFYVCGKGSVMGAADSQVWVRMLGSACVCEECESGIQKLICIKLQETHTYSIILRICWSHANTGFRWLFIFSVFYILSACALFCSPQLQRIPSVCLSKLSSQETE